MELQDFILDEELSDESYRCYHAAIPVTIYKDVLTDEDLEINIHVSCNLSDLLACINDYLCWLQNCEEEVCGYYTEGHTLTHALRAGALCAVMYSKLIKESLPKDWFEKLSVYHASLTFQFSNDYGATISFGDSIFPDHILEFDFERQEVIGDQLNG